MNKIKIIFFATLSFFLFLFLIYLLLPAQKPPPLPNSLKSTEPGDTVQVPGVSAYYSDMQRREVMEFYARSFSRSPFFGIPLPQIRLNHPVEYANQMIRDPFFASYFEEIVHPFRESLFVGGWEPENAPLEYKKKTGGVQIVVDNKVYASKATLRYITSPLWARISVFILTMASIYALYFLLRKIINSRWQH